MMKGFWAILLKEFAHIRRDRSTLPFAFLIPAIQLTIFGYAINVTIEHIPTVVLDFDGRQESRLLADTMEATRTFTIVRRATSQEDFRRSLTSGRARVGVVIPPDYSDRLLRRQQAVVQVLIDGSDSQVGMTALNTVNLLVMQMSIARAKSVGESIQTGPARDVAGNLALPIAAAPRMLYNPQLESSHFFVPALIALILQFVLLFLTSMSIVKEREQGTLEQLFVTPVSPTGLLLGKLVPYVLIAALELLVILAVMVGLFGVPIAGSLWLLLVLSWLFIFTVLALGLLVSTLARSQIQAGQFTVLIMLPSVFLTGFMFPRQEMPRVLVWLGEVLPVTHFLEILRGIILRNADMADLLPHILGLSLVCAAIVTISLLRFRKRLD